MTERPIPVLVTLAERPPCSPTTPTKMYTTTATLRRSRRSLPMMLAACVGLSILLSLYHHRGISIYGRQGMSDQIDILNRTLGFQNVYVISFPERTDKRDALTLSSSITGFDFDWSDGVTFESVAKKAAPPTWNYETESKGALGCWRAHMDVLQTIVRNKIQTALVLEDDADWDVSLKEQLFNFATGVKTLQPGGSRQALTSPYGDAWDFLWLGNCKVGPADDEVDFYVTPEDPTVPPLARRHGKWANSHVPDEVLSNNTRLIFRTNGGGLCMFAYAITYQGARKALSSLSLTSQNYPVDLSYRYMCQSRLGQRFLCYGVYPTLFATHRSAGPRSRDSDLNDKGNDWHAEYTWDIVYSTAQNVPRLLAGASSALSQWPNDTASPERFVREPLPTGLPKYIDLASLERVSIKGVNV